MFWPSKYLREPSTLTHMEIQERHLLNLIFPFKSHYISYLCFWFFPQLKIKKAHVCQEIKTSLNKHYEKDLGLGISSIITITEIQMEI